MADPSPATSENAANLMSEALDKSSVELEKAVSACIEQLHTFNEALEKSFASQLQKVIEQSRHFVDSNSEDLSAHREELIDRLSEFERSEIETMVAAGKDVRSQVTARAQQASDSISRLVEEQIAELRSLIENPDKRFKEIADNGKVSLDSIKKSGLVKMQQDEHALEQELSEKAQKLDENVQTVIAESKAGINEILDKHNAAMEEKIAAVVQRLNDKSTEIIDELKKKTEGAAQALTDSVIEGTEKLGSHLTQWKDECGVLRSEFEDALQKDSEKSEANHASKLERKVTEVKEEINHIAQDANAKIAASHKLFFSSLRRLEKKYNDRLERLLSRFENALAEEARLSNTGSNQPTHELRELMNARLQARGKEILKAFQRQVEQIESEYARTSSGSHEKLESIRSAAVESLDKQIRIMKSELDRVSRSFQNELADLQAQLPEIEEAGRAAALAVEAYRSAMLSFSAD